VLRDAEPLHADGRHPLLYLYAIAEGADEDHCRDVPGVGGTPVRSLRHRGLDLLYSEVERRLFDEAAIARAMVTTDWLESTVAAHDAVLRTVSAQGVAVIPLRLGTTSEDGDAAARLDDWFHAARHKLQTVTGASEWRVTVVLHSRAGAGTRSVEPTRETADHPASAPCAGRHRADVGDLDREASRMHATLSRAARAARRVPTNDIRLAGTPGEPVMSGTYLVPDDDTGQFASEIEQIAQQHSWATVLSRGPLPPYSFAYIVQE
jgi:hypothetical protein